MFAMMTDISTQQVALEMFVETCSKHPAAGNDNDDVWCSLASRPLRPLYFCRATALCANTSTTLHSNSFLTYNYLFFSSCCCGCFVPYCMRSCKTANHYCPQCKAFIGSYTPSWFSTAIHLLISNISDLNLRHIDRMLQENNTFSF